MLSDGDLHLMAERLAGVDGVVGVALGGSRARGHHYPDSDVDIGLYYRGELDVESLASLAMEFGGPTARITEPGGWGPWVDGGGWLTAGGVAVDWIYRDIERVRHSWAESADGVVAFLQQAGHPFGFANFAYAGELAVARVLADPFGELDDLRRPMEDYPAPLGNALVEGLWEAEFLTGGARKVISRGDAAYVSGCLFRAWIISAHALHGAAGQWLLNEKGAVAAAGRLDIAPVDYAGRIQAISASVGSEQLQLGATLDAAVALLAETRRSCAAGISN